MQKFYEGCFCDKSCPERCFDCARPDIIKEKWIHSLGFYHPRFRPEYKKSKWSQAILKAKKKSMAVILSFGRITAWYMDKRLAGMKPYLITNVPAFRSDEMYSFRNFETCLTQLLAWAVFANLKNKKWVDKKQVLVQTREKATKQRYCNTDVQRKKNIAGIYTVPEPSLVEGKNVILLDDVVTSGATMRGCANELFEAGAKAVVGLALARTFRINTLPGYKNNMGGRSYDRR